MKKKDIHVGEEYWIPSSINNTIPSPRFERYEVLAYSPNRVSPAEKARFQQVLRRYESEGKREEGERWVKQREQQIIEGTASDRPWVVRSVWVDPAGEHQRGIPKRKKFLSPPGLQRRLHCRNRQPSTPGNKRFAL